MEEIERWFVPYGAENGLNKQLSARAMAEGMRLHHCSWQNRVGFSVMKYSVHSGCFLIVTRESRSIEFCKCWTVCVSEDRAFCPQNPQNAGLSVLQDWIFRGQRTSHSKEISRSQVPLCDEVACH